MGLSRCTVFLALVALTSVSGRLFEWKMVSPLKGNLCSNIKEGDMVGIPDILLSNPQENFFRTESDGVMQVNYVLSYRSGMLKGERLVAGEVLAVHRLRVGGEQKTSYTIELSNDGMVREVLLYGNIPMSGVKDGIYCIGDGAIPMNRLLKPLGSTEKSVLTRGQEEEVQKSIVELPADDDEPREFGASQVQALALAEEESSGDMNSPTGAHAKPKAPAADKVVTKAVATDITVGRQVDRETSDAPPSRSGETISESGDSHTVKIEVGSRHAEGESILQNAVKMGSLDERLLTKVEEMDATLVPNWEPQFAFAFLGAKQTTKKTNRQLNLKVMNKGSAPVKISSFKVTVDGKKKEIAEECVLAECGVDKALPLYSSSNTCPPIKYDNSAKIELRIERNHVDFTESLELTRLPQENYMVYFVVLDEVPPNGVGEEVLPTDTGDEESDSGDEESEARSKAVLSDPVSSADASDEASITRGVATSDLVLGMPRHTTTVADEEGSDDVTSGHAPPKKVEEDAESKHTTPPPSAGSASLTKHLAESEVDALKESEATCSNSGKLCAASGQWSADVTLYGAEFSYADSMSWLVQTGTRAGRTAKGGVRVSQMSAYSSGLAGSSAFKKVMVDLKVNPLKERDSVALADNTVVWTVDKGANSDGVLVAGCSKERVLILPRIHEGSSEAVYYDVSLGNGKVSKVWIDLTKGKGAVCPCCPTE